MFSTTWRKCCSSENPFSPGGASNVCGSWATGKSMKWGASRRVRSVGWRVRLRLDPTMTWTSSHGGNRWVTGDAGPFSCFAFDGETRVLGVLRHGSISERNVPKIFRMLLSRGELEREGGPTTEWTLSPSVTPRNSRRG